MLAIISVLRIRNARLQNTHDDGASGIDEGTEPHSLADDGRITVQSCRPETIGQDDGAGGLRTVVARVQQSAKQRGAILSPGNTILQRLRPGPSEVIQVPPAWTQELRSRRGGQPLSSRLTNGRSRTPRTRAEHRGIGADSQRQSQNNGHGAALCTAERTDRGSQIAKKRDDGLNHAKSPFQVFSKSLAAAKASQDEGG
jgi:hypothetical protein